MMPMRLESIQDTALQKGVLFYYIHLNYTFTKNDFYFNCKYQ
ncbi:glycerophosphoryl diester phosphodiesterase family protein [Staphylococcus aureus subsp. aureus SA9908]|nr:glycerophosphoryl diester phosphodiesterase family protein [Staphylococcus aureus subsp. aureus SA9908]